MDVGALVEDLEKALGSVEKAFLDGGEALFLILRFICILHDFVENRLVVLQRVYIALGLVCFLFIILQEILDTLPLIGSLLFAFLRLSLLTQIVRPLFLSP